MLTSCAVFMIPGSSKCASGLDPANVQVACRKNKKLSRKTSGLDFGSPVRDYSLVKSVNKHAAKKLLEKVPVTGDGSAVGSSCATVNRATVKDLQPWAGPSYYTSPPPENVPMPTSFLLAV